MKKQKEPIENEGKPIYGKSDLINNIVLFILKILNYSLSFFGESKSKLKSLLVLTFEFFLVQWLLSAIIAEYHMPPLPIDAKTGRIEIERNGTNWKRTALHDISQVKIAVQPNPSINTSRIVYANLGSISGIVEFSSFSIQPDEITQNAIFYRKRRKVEKIKQEGLIFYAKFPRKMNYQNIRVSITTILLSIIIAKSLKCY